MTPRIQPMEPGHPQYERFQNAVEELSHPNDWMRVTAAQAIGRIGHPDGIKPLEKALNSPYQIVRGSAAEAIGAIGTLTDSNH